MSRLASHLADKHHVELFTWEDPVAVPAYPLAPGVRLVRAGLLGGRGMSRLAHLAARVPRLRRELHKERPDVVVSFIDTMNLTALAAAHGLDVPIVVSERIDSSAHPVHPFLRVARACLYPRAARLVVQTERAARPFRKRLGERVAVVGNPVDRPPVAASPDRPASDGRFWVIAMGRLESQKGFDRLIDAFARVASRHPLWGIKIYGEGSQHRQLAGRVSMLGLASRVRLEGLTRDPARALADAHLMAFPSRYEGFPNALAEGLSSGLPAIGYAGVSGVEDLVIPGKTGMLLEIAQDPVEALAAALDALMSDPARRLRLGEGAASHCERWSAARVLARWEEVLLEVVTEARSSQ